MTVNFEDPRVPDRIWSKIAVAEDGCWNWTAARCGPGGQYGGTNWTRKRKNVRAHRLMFELLVRMPEPDEHIHHTCENKLCVNPAHLEALKAGDHHRLHAASRELASHCKWGHPFDETNTLYTGGKRVCRTCDNERHRAMRLRRALERAT